MSTKPSDHLRYIKQLAQKFVERATACELKGKKRDDAAIDFWCGAAALAEITNQHELSNRLGAIVALVLSTRGYREVERLSRD